MTAGKYPDAETFRDWNGLELSARLFFPTVQQSAFPLCTKPSTLQPENLINISNNNKKNVCEEKTMSLYHFAVPGASKS